MPIALWRHAIASVNETTSILISSRSTWFFSHVSQQFQAGPSLIEARNGHTSGTIKDKVTMENIVAVIGSYYKNTTDTTELLINGESEWQQGKNHVN